MDVSPSFYLSSPSLTSRRTPSPDKSNTGLYRKAMSHTLLAHIPTLMDGAIDPWTPVAHSSTHLQMLTSPDSLSSDISLFDKSLTDPLHVPFELLSSNWKTSESYVSPVVHSSVSTQLIKQPTLGTPFLTKLLKAVPATPPVISSPRNSSDVLSPFCTNYSLNSSQSLSNPTHSPCQSIGHYEDSGLSNTLPSAFPSGSKPVTPRTSNIENLFALTPLTALSDDTSFVTPARAKSRTKRKRPIADSLSPLSRPKKSCNESTPRHTDIGASQSLTFPQRTFPRLTDFEFHPEFALFYRRFPSSSFFLFEDNQPTRLFDAKHPGGTYNPPRDAFDLYTPRFVKGIGKTKVGLCPICIEAPERGGEGKKVWFSMKFSAFKCYHMQYGHGISASTGLPFSPPTNFRVTVRPRPAKLEKSEMIEGKCHKCRKWVPIQGVKDVETKVKELFWWKHAAACHNGSNVKGEGDFYVEDKVYKWLKELES